MTKMSRPSSYWINCRDQSSIGEGSPDLKRRCCLAIGDEHPEIVAMVARKMA